MEADHFWFLIRNLKAEFLDIEAQRPSLGLQLESRYLCQMHLPYASFSLPNDLFRRILVHDLGCVAEVSDILQRPDQKWKPLKARGPPLRFAPVGMTILFLAFVGQHTRCHELLPAILLILLIDERIGHACNVVADHARQRLLLPLFRGNCAAGRRAPPSSGRRVLR